MFRTLLAACSLALVLVPLSLRADGFIYIPEYTDVIRQPGRVGRPQGGGRRGWGWAAWHMYIYIYKYI